MNETGPILLGACPFCNGGVTASIGETNERGLGLWYIVHRYADRPTCANGCPIDRFNDHRICRDGWNADEDFDPAPSFRWAWAQHVRKFRERAACPHCGGPARIRTGANPAVGCPRCGLWAGDVHYDGATVIGLVEAWNRFAEKEGNDGIL